MTLMIWVATATYGPDDDIDPLVAAATTKPLAEHAIYEKIEEWCADQDDPKEYESQWIAQEPVPVQLHGAKEILW